MNKKILIILLMFPIFAYSQYYETNDFFEKKEKKDSLIKIAETTTKTSQKIQLLSEIISLQDSLIDMMFDSIRKSQLLSNIISNKDSLIYKMNNTIQKMSSFEHDAKLYHFFSTTDVSIFSNGFIEIEDTNSLPKEFLSKYEIIRLIKQISECVIILEKKAQSVSSEPDINENKRKDIVKNKTESDLEKIDDLFSSLDQLNTESLSAEQENFKKNLSIRVNNFLTTYIF